MSASLFSLQGQVVLVTGATGGLGQAIAQVCAQQGAALALSDLPGAALGAATHALQAQGHEALAVPGDLADPRAAAQVLQAAHGWRNRLDTLVCNAGIQGPAGRMGDADDEAWQRVLQVNLKSAAALAGGAAPLMAHQGGGSLVFMASIASLRGNGRIGLYGLSKAALAQLARNLAVEWGPRNVRANAVSPGLIHTPLAAGLMADAAFMQRRLAATPLRRVGQPQEVAGVVALLASAAGAFITGQNLVVDGGTLISDGS